MPDNRNADGVPTEKPSTAVDARLQDNQPTEGNPSPQPSQGFEDVRGDDPLESSTTVLRDPSSMGEDKHTAVYRPSKSSATSESPSQRKTSSHAMTDPPVGWFVIVGGPGQGNVVTIRHGRNSIGRSPEDRIPLNYGDEMISRNGHAFVIYDPDGRKFYIQQGQGTNLIYINDVPVLEATLLAPLTHIRIGRTVLRFVPLCGEEFDWSDERD